MITTNQVSDISESRPAISWAKSDIERKFCFPAGKYTSVNALFTFIMGIICSVAFYLAILPFPQYYVHTTFYERGIIPYLIIGFFFWTVMIIFVKWRKCALQRKALKLSLVPSDPDFVLSPQTADTVIRNVYESVDDPKHFVLLHRIVRVLSNLRNIGRISDVDDMLRSQGENDEQQMESSYALIKGFIWAIPVLGFIGTVLGLSMAVGGFGKVLSTGAEISTLKNALQQVTVGLAVGFETTLQGLVGALILQLMTTAMRKSEHEFLDECHDYCHRNIVSKLRIMPLENEK